MQREFITGLASKFTNQFTANNAGNMPALLALGGFKFSLNTAAFTERERRTNYRWRGLERVGQYDALQYTGPGEDVITLPGVVYPDFKGGRNQISDLRAMAEAGEPYALLDSDGRLLGRWVITDVTERQSNFNEAGQMRRQEFTITLRKFGNADV